MSSLALASCDVSTADPAALGSSPALEACSRSDVQEIVGKETRSKMLKAALPRLLTQAVMGLVDINQVADEFTQAKVSFYNVGLDDPATQSGPPFNRVICSARLQLDMSDAVAGQQIIGVERLRWVINFPEAVDDPTAGMFTVDVDAPSILRGLTVNGRPVVSEGAEEQQVELDNEDRGPDEVQAPASNAVEGAQTAAQSPADQGGRDAVGTGADANVGGEARVSSGALDPNISTDRRKQNTSQPPSDEDLYAPHNN